MLDHVHVTTPVCPLGAPECRSRLSFSLGRPWREFSRVVVMNSDLPDTLVPAGWSKWKSDDPTPKAFYAEYNNSGPGASPSTRAPWSHQLTAKEAEAYTPARFLAGSDHWNALAEADRLP